jgi:hypothetical protein
MTQRMDFNAVTPAGVKALNGVYGHVMHPMPHMKQPLPCLTISSSPTSRSLVGLINADSRMA